MPATRTTVSKVAPGSTDDLELLEMANLPREDTGVDGIIYISSAQGSHGPRVNWYPQAPISREAPCLSVTIDAHPAARNLNLPSRVADGAVDPVTRWVAANHVALIDFWENGYSWTRQRVNAFIEGLVKVG